MKTVKISLAEVEPLGSEIIEFLIKKFPKWTPESTALVIGALKFSEMYFTEGLEQVDGTIAFDHEDKGSGGWVSPEEIEQ